ncbi:MAG: ATP-grasp domain-containing protein [Acidobacteriota bacterium]
MPEPSDPMRLLEHEGKQLLGHLGMSAPRGSVATTPAGAGAAAAQMGAPVVVKGQVPEGGRGKAGGIRKAATPAEAEEAARALIGMQIGEHRVESVLVEELVPFTQECYAGVTVDWTTGQMLALLSASGGIDVEAASARSADAVARVVLDPLAEFQAYEARNLARRAGLSGRALVSVADALVRLVRGAAVFECLLVEVNPLFLLPDGRVVAGDAKIEVDDSALPRQHRALAEAIPAAVDALAERANAEGAQIAYVPIDGDIGIIAGGAGLALATMDTVFEYGGRPADFLDIGGGGASGVIARALRMLLARTEVRGVVINVYGGINNCEVMARGIADVCEKDHPAVPIVVKMRGHFQEEGWAILESHGVPIVKQGTTDDAVMRILDLVERRASA